MPDRGEHAHIETTFGDQDLRGFGLNPGDGAQQFDDLGVGFEHELDPLGQVLQLQVERVDVRERLRDHDPVMLDRETALKRFSKLRNLRAHLALGELSELLWVGHSAEERFEQRPSLAGVNPGPKILTHHG